MTARPSETTSRRAALAGLGTGGLGLAILDRLTRAAAGQVIVAS